MKSPKRVSSPYLLSGLFVQVSLAALLGNLISIGFANSVEAASMDRNAIIFVADGLRPSSVTPSLAPTLYNIRQNGVNFVNSHALFPTFTTPNASAIATGHYLGDTGDFSNTIYPGFPVPSSNGGSVTPFIENNPVLSDIDEHFGGNFLNEESLLAAARMAGFNTAAVGKLGPVLIQDVTQGNGGVTPTTVIVDDTTGKTGGVPLRSDVAASITNNPFFTNTYVTPGYTSSPTVTPSRSNGCTSSQQCNNGFSGSNTTPGTTSPNTIQQQYFTDVVTQAILPTFRTENKPFAMVYWSRDPDGTQHNQGDSLNTLTPGINGPTSQAAVTNVDNNLKQIITYLTNTDDPKSPGKKLIETTDIFVTADHGFSTISKQAIDAQGTPTKSYAASLTYSGVNPGFLPKGFVAIDLAHALGLPLYDPDNAATPVNNGNIEYPLVDPTQGQLPKFGDGLIGGTGKVANGNTDAQIIVAANGGSDLIYLPSKDPNLAKQVVNFLTTQDYIDGIFVDDDLGSIPGSLPLSAINLKGSAKTPTPSIVINFKTFDTGCGIPAACQVEIADTGLQQGQGMHGSFGRGDTLNNMAAIGPDFVNGFVDHLPVSNADVAITLANILGLNIPNQGSLQGRVLSEALNGGNINGFPLSQGSSRSTPAANSYQTTVSYQDVNGTRYFDTANGKKVPEPSGVVGLLATAGLVGFLYKGRLIKK